MTPDAYAAYLDTPHWRTLRRLALEAADNRCLLCDASETLEVHHRTYERLGAERLRDLVVLCEACHGRHHGVLLVAMSDETIRQRVRELESELAAEMAGAAHLARQVEVAWTDGGAEGERRARAAPATDDVTDADLPTDEPKIARAS